MSTSTAAPKSAQVSRVPYLPGLDGLRALAVLAVIVYHANSSWLPGGFLGVEVFFVISGYLITLLLVAEHERTGTVDLLDFWKRRARRLLPALFLMLLLLVVWTTFFEEDALGALRGDVVAGLLYVSNWFQVWVGAGYTAVNDFAPLRHLWSLAVEEQFYLLWPLVMMLILRSGRTRLPRVSVWFVAIAFGIVAVVGLLMPTGRIGADCVSTPDAYWEVGGRCVSKVDVLYLSTPSRATGLLLGAAMALVWRPYALLRGPMRNKGRLLDPFAIGGLLVLGYLVSTLHITELVGEEGTYADPWLFRGGFFLTGLATLVVIAAVAHTRSSSGGLIGNPVFRAIGERSYGLYLYHWPVFQALRHETGIPLAVHEFIGAMAVTVAITEISYRFVELPIRERRFKATWTSILRRGSNQPRLISVGLAGVMIAVPIFAAVSLATAENKLNEVQAALDEGESAVVDALEAVSSTTVPPSTSLAPEDSAPPTTMPTAPHYDVFALGDSVMKGAAVQLAELGVVVDAEQDRQGKMGADILLQLRELGVTMDNVVIHLGTNGSMSQETLDRMMGALSEVRTVVILTGKARRDWTAPNNDKIRALPQRYANVIVLDWEREVEACVGECLTRDGIHLDKDGRVFYAQLIWKALGRTVPPA